MYIVFKYLVVFVRDGPLSLAIKRGQLLGSPPYTITDYFC